VLATRDRVEVDHLPRLAQENEILSNPPAGAPRLSADEELLRDRLIGQLRECEGNVTAVAKAMGEHRTQIYRWLADFALDPGEFRAAPRSDVQ